VTFWRRLLGAPVIHGRLWAYRELLKQAPKPTLTIVKDSRIVRFRKRMAA
jgi:hypothetical protein